MLTALIVSVMTAAAPDQAIDAALIPGVWAAGENSNACDNASITVFFSDGALIVFDSPHGPIHAVATWHVVDGKSIEMTYNRAPFAGEKSRPPAELSVQTLTSEKFVTANSEGLIRARVRCPTLAVPAIGPSPLKSIR